MRTRLLARQRASLVHPVIAAVRSPACPGEILPPAPDPLPGSAPIVAARAPHCCHPCFPAAPPAPLASCWDRRSLDTSFFGWLPSLAVLSRPRQTLSPSLTRSLPVEKPIRWVNVAWWLCAGGVTCILAFPASPLSSTAPRLHASIITAFLPPLRRPRLRIGSLLHLARSRFLRRSRSATRGRASATCGAARRSSAGFNCRRRPAPRARPRLPTHRLARAPLRASPARRVSPYRRITSRSRAFHCRARTAQRAMWDQCRRPCRGRRRAPVAEVAEEGARTRTRQRPHSPRRRPLSRTRSSAPGITRDHGGYAVSRSCRSTPGNSRQSCQLGGQLSSTG